MGRRIERILCYRYTSWGVARVPEELAVEEPLAIELDGVLVATTMRTPGHDFELAAGFLHAEGMLAGAPIRSCRFCGDSAPRAGLTQGYEQPALDYNTVSVDTAGLAPVPTPRLGPTTAACGLCGAESIRDLANRLPRLTGRPGPSLAVSTDMVVRLRREQPLFDRTGAVHAAAAFDCHGTILLCREDVGRHNAVDKVVGRLLLDHRLPASELGLVVSGRASFEIVQKAWAAGFGTVVAVSAPTSLAVATAREAGLVLLGFARNGAANIYAPEQRLMSTLAETTEKAGE